ncbi:uncharacterized protein LOC116844341 isoform X2 [Odontomachus brunneus]|uniref:uncharacterized protein LOC116844341 isoform X2 n=1 Tax=Odontomachus brunneus TaxID=486640 RepID=UPI0013F258DF|nr:uncharacterized protein LOC116844341 isoform X2 [Odontomachus brunneus]
MKKSIPVCFHTRTGKTGKKRLCSLSPSSALDTDLAFPSDSNDRPRSSCVREPHRAFSVPIVSYLELQVHVPVCSLRSVERCRHLHTSRQRQTSRPI